MSQIKLRPTFERLSRPREPWLKWACFNAGEWLLTNRADEIRAWIDLLKEHQAAPADLPPFPFHVFGPADLIVEISTIGADALNFEVVRCREQLSHAHTEPQGRLRLKHLSSLLEYCSGLLRLPELQPAPETYEQLEALIARSDSSRLVDFASLYLHLNRLRTCHNPGTVMFLDDVENVTLRKNWPPACMRSEIMQYLDPRYCGVVSCGHAAFNARALLVALNFCYFGRLQKIRGNSDDCSSWVPDPELTKRRNQILCDLRATGREALVSEIVRCQWRIESWFPKVVSERHESEIDDGGPIARPLQALLRGTTGALTAHSSASGSGQEAAASQQLANPAPPAAVAAAAPPQSPDGLFVTPSSSPTAAKANVVPRLESLESGSKDDSEQPDTDASQLPEAHPDEDSESSTVRGDEGPSEFSVPAQYVLAEQAEAHKEAEEAQAEKANADAGRTKKSEKKKRQKAARKERRRAAEALLALTSTAAPVPNVTAVPDTAAYAEKPADNAPEAILKGTDDAEKATEKTTKTTTEKAHEAIAKAAGDVEKAKRKAKEQRRKERRRIAREAEAEKKRLQQEAKALQRRREEERKREELDRRWAEQQQLWEEQKRLAKEEEEAEAAAAARALEAVALQQAEDTGREEHPLHSEEPSHCSEEPASPGEEPVRQNEEPARQSKEAASEDEEALLAKANSADQASPAQQPANPNEARARNAVPDPAREVRPDGKVFCRDEDTGRTEEAAPTGRHHEEAGRSEEEASAGAEVRPEEACLNKARPGRQGPAREAQVQEAGCGGDDTAIDVASRRPDDVVPRRRQHAESLGRLDTEEQLARLVADLQRLLESAQEMLRQSRSRSQSQARRRCDLCLSQPPRPQPAGPGSLGPPGETSGSTGNGPLRGDAGLATPPLPAEAAAHAADGAEDDSETGGSSACRSPVSQQVQQLMERIIQDPESMYPPAPRSVAHSRARSVDRGAFAR